MENAMRKQISSIVLAIVVLLTIVQFGPSLLFGKEVSPAKACHYREHRIAAGPQDRIPAMADAWSQAKSGTSRVMPLT
jgi:hypothetical protein